MALTALEKYRREEKLNFSQLARLLDRDRETVRRWCLGKNEPRPADRKHIQKATGGKILITPVLVQAEE